VDTRLDHVRANVADLRRAVEWYTTVLGFEVESFWPPDRPNYAHFKSSGGATFAVMEAEGRGARFNFTVDDPDALWIELKNEGRSGRAALRYALRHSQVHDLRPGRERTRASCETQPPPEKTPPRTQLVLASIRNAGAAERLRLGF